MHQGARPPVAAVLSIGKLSLGQEAYYLEEVLDGAEDYYVTVGEAPGRWVGAGAARLGLGGTVEADDLRAVLAGRRPGGNQPLRATRTARPGLDLTLSAPKSVSLVWGLGDQATAEVVVGCHDRAVDAALEYLEGHACHVRRGHGGATVCDGEGFVGAAFRHRTSRAGDPALHTHVLVANLAEGPDGRWTALDWRDLYGHARTAGFVYQAVLRYELAQRPGLLFEEVAQGHADVAGVPPDLRQAFSHRRQEIVAAMERHGARSAKAAQAATLDTRLAKSEHVSESELRRRWATQAEPFGVDITELPRLVRAPVLDVDEAELTERLTESHATFVRRDVVRALAQSATQGASLEELEHGADAWCVSASAVQVADGRWTTPEMLALERQTVELAAHGPRAGFVAPSLVAASIAARPSLGSDQQAAVRAIVSSGRPVDVLVGPAGTGKTFSLDAAREAWEQAGYRVVGASLAARAAAQLEHGSGITSQTVDRLRLRLAQGTEHLDQRTVLVLDEAAMIGTRRLAAMIGDARTGRAKVVLIGDARQLPEIDAGGLFSALAQRLGYAELTENRRQRDPEEQAVASELRLGHVESALARLQRHERMVTADNADLLRDGLVGDWYAARAEGDDVLMVAARRSSVADLNHRARELLAARGELGETVLESSGVSFAVGDEVLALRNDYRLGLINGSRGVVSSASDEALTVKLANARVVEVPIDYVEAGNITHGYAATVHKSQGVTCDRLFVLGDDTFTIETAYTSLTRGRLSNQLYLTASEHDMGHGRAAELDPLASFSAALHRSGAKTAAIDHLEPAQVEL
ncbi:MAG TPA: MobF family relaxase [Acidimicrobiales bacterium]|nr:MobF family relaxase [Acidimicrobiales bacterium]